MAHAALKSDGFRSKRNRALAHCLRIISAQTHFAFFAMENRCPLFRIMRWPTHALVSFASLPSVRHHSEISYIVWPRGIRPRVKELPR
jgi:hypothetical protein